MPLPRGLDSIAGAQELYDWFGYWPGFHDAEILSFRLGIGEPSSLVVHTWEMTNKINAQGFYELTKHVVVEFALQDISNVNLGDLWERSIFSTLAREKPNTASSWIFPAAYGIYGTIEAQGLS
ncbi:MAG: hypothetical protein WAL56_15330, partial [Candidatus Sulfotelmatobacter sp.]